MRAEYLPAMDYEAAVGSGGRCRQYCWREFLTTDQVDEGSDAMMVERMLGVMMQACRQSCGRGKGLES